MRTHSFGFAAALVAAAVLTGCHDNPPPIFVVDAQWHLPATMWAALTPAGRAQYSGLRPETCDLTKNAAKACGVYRDVGGFYDLTIQQFANDPNKFHLQQGHAGLDATWTQMQQGIQVGWMFVRIHA